METDDLRNRFTYHKPKADQLDKYEGIRARGLELADFIVLSTPQSREQSLAITKLEEAIFWANASIARNE